MDIQGFRYLERFIIIRKLLLKTYIPILWYNKRCKHKDGVNIYE